MLIKGLVKEPDTVGYTLGNEGAAVRIPRILDEKHVWKNTVNGLAQLTG
jgi:hypothetical protein